MEADECCVANTSTCYAFGLFHLHIMQTVRKFHPSEKMALHFSSIFEGLRFSLTLSISLACFVSVAHYCQNKTAKRRDNVTSVCVKIECLLFNYSHVVFFLCWSPFAFFFGSVYKFVCIQMYVSLAMDIPMPSNAKSSKSAVVMLHHPKHKRWWMPHSWHGYIKYV